MGSYKGKGMARAKMPTLFTNRHLSVGRDHIKGFILGHIGGLIPIYNLWGMKDEMASDVLYVIIVLDLVTTRHFSQFQLMWQHHSCWCSPYRKWWVVFSVCIGQLFDKTRNEMNNWRLFNPRAWGDQVGPCILCTTSLVMVQCTGMGFCVYCSNDLRAKIEQPSRLQDKPGNFMPGRPLHEIGIINEDDKDMN